MFSNVKCTDAIRKQMDTCRRLESHHLSRSNAMLGASKTHNLIENDNTIMPYKFYMKAFDVMLENFVEPLMEEMHRARTTLDGINKIFENRRIIKTVNYFLALFAIRFSIQRNYFSGTSSQVFWVLGLSRRMAKDQRFCKNCFGNKLSSKRR